MSRRNRFRKPKKYVTQPNFVSGSEPSGKDGRALPPSGLIQQGTIFQRGVIVGKKDQEKKREDIFHHK